MPDDQADISSEMSLQFIAVYQRINYYNAALLRLGELAVERKIQPSELRAHVEQIEQPRHKWVAIAEALEDGITTLPKVSEASVIRLMERVKALREVIDASERVDDLLNAVADAASAMDDAAKTEA